MDRYFNRASSLTGLRELAGMHSADLLSAMNSAGLGMEILRKPEERTEFARICALFETCARDWGLPDFGLRLAPYQQLDILGPVGLVTRMARNVRGALEAITDNMVIHCNALMVSLEEEEGVASIIVDTQPAPQGTRQYTLLALGVARNILEQAANGKVELIEVSLRQENDRLRPAAEAYFRCPVRFDAERDAIHFDAALLDQPVERTDPAYHAIIERYLATTRQEVAGRLGDAARREIARQMEFGKCTLESVAQRLRLEPRSLQRRLKQEGIAFRDLMDDWRRQRALSLVVQTRLPLSEVTLALGYSDQSIFSRAFQRWYGTSPLAYRLGDIAPAMAARAPRALH